MSRSATCSTQQFEVVSRKIVGHRRRRDEGRDRQSDQRRPPDPGRAPWRATTALMLTGDPIVVGRDSDVERRVSRARAVVAGLRSGAAAQDADRRYGHGHGADGIWAVFRGKAVSCHRCGQRHRPRDRVAAGRAGRRAVSDRPRRRRPGADRGRRPRAGRARYPSIERLISPTTTTVAAFAADIHTRHPEHGRRDEHRRRIGLGHRRPAHPRALEQDGRRST